MRLNGLESFSHLYQHHCHFARFYDHINNHHWQSHFHRHYHYHHCHLIAVIIISIIFIKF